MDHRELGEDPVKAGDLVTLIRGMGRIPILQRKDFYSANNSVVTRINCSTLCLVLSVETTQVDKESYARVLTTAGHVGWAYVQDFCKV